MKAPKTCSGTDDAIFFKDVQVKHPALVEIAIIQYIKEEADMVASIDLRLFPEADEGQAIP